MWLGLNLQWPSTIIIQLSVWWSITKQTSPLQICKSQVKQQRFYLFTSQSVTRCSMVTIPLKAHVHTIPERIVYVVEIVLPMMSNKSCHHVLYLGFCWNWDQMSGFVSQFIYRMSFLAASALLLISVKISLSLMMMIDGLFISSSTI